MAALDSPEWAALRRDRLRRFGTATHCQRGHEYTEENTYRSPDGKRRCRACKSASDKERNRIPPSQRAPRTPRPTMFAPAGRFREVWESDD